METIEAVNGLIYVALVLQRYTVHKELTNNSLDFQIGKRGPASLSTSLRLSGEHAALRLLLAKVLPYWRPVEPSKEYHLNDKYEEDEDEDCQTILDEIL